MGIKEGQNNQRRDGEAGGRGGVGWGVVEQEGTPQRSKGSKGVSEN